MLNVFELGLATNVSYSYSLVPNFIVLEILWNEQDKLCKQWDSYYATKLALIW